jgi:hypothetical protein
MVSTLELQNMTSAAGFPTVWYSARNHDIYVCENEMDGCARGWGSSWHGKVFFSFLLFCSAVDHTANSTNSHNYRNSFSLILQPIPDPQQEHADPDAHNVLSSCDRLQADCRHKATPCCQATTRHGGRSSPSSQASWFQVPATKKQIALKNFWQQLHQQLDDMSEAFVITASKNILSRRSTLEEC